MFKNVNIIPATITMIGRGQNLFALSLDSFVISLCVSGFTKLIVLTNTAVISPVQTESSNTAAKGELRRNIIMVIIALVEARPIVDFKRLLVMTVHKAAATIAVRSMISTDVIFIL
jgi:hypothetical protein